MDQQHKINLTLTEITNLNNIDGKLTIIDQSKLIKHQFDPRQDVSVYDRRSLEEQIITISAFDSGTHLLKSGEKYFFVVDFETVLR